VSNSEASTSSLFKAEVSGTASKTYTSEEIAKDKEIRMLISEELGHSRINITSVYLGSWSKK
jgi:hypothetical protein